MSEKLYENVPSTSNIISRGKESHIPVCGANVYPSMTPEPEPGSHESIQQPPDHLFSTPRTAHRIPKNNPLYPYSKHVSSFLILTQSPLSPKTPHNLFHLRHHPPSAHNPSLAQIRPSQGKRLSKRPTRFRISRGLGMGHARFPRRRRTRLAFDPAR